MRFSENKMRAPTMGWNAPSAWEWSYTHDRGTCKRAATCLAVSIPCNPLRRKADSTGQQIGIVERELVVRRVDGIGHPLHQPQQV